MERKEANRWRHKLKIAARTPSASSQKARWTEFQFSTSMNIQGFKKELQNRKHFNKSRKNSRRKLTNAPQLEPKKP